MNSYTFIEHGKKLISELHAEYMEDKDADIELPGDAFDLFAVMAASGAMNAALECFDIMECIGQAVIEG